jgi:WD40 repeat protein
LARWGKGTVSDLAWSPDGQLLAAATSLGVYLYSARSTEYVQFLPASTPVQSVAFSPDGQTIAAAGETMASVWRLSDGVLLRTVAELPGGTQDVVLTPGNDLVIAGVSQPGSAWVWAGGNTAILNPLEGTDLFSDVDTVTVSPDGQTVAGAAFAGSTWLWRASDGALLRTLPGPDEFETVDHLAFSPDGQVLASMDTSSVRLWRVADGTLLRTIYGRNSMGWCMAFSADGQVLATGGYDEARLWRVPDGTLVAAVQYPTMVSSVALSPDGQTLGVALLGGSVRLWQADQGSPPQDWMGHWWGIGGLAFSPDGESLAVSTYDSVWLWSLAEGAPFLRMWAYWPGGGSPALRVSSVAFSPDGQTVASGSSDGQVLLWRVADGTLVRTLSAPLEGYALNSFGAPPVASIAFSPDGSLLVAGWGGGSVLLWRPADGVLLHEHREGSPWSSIEGVAFSPDGQLLAYGPSAGRTVIRWARGRIWMRTLGKEGEQALDLAFSPDGQLLACACGETMELWQVADGSSLFPFWWHEGRVLSVAFSPDGSILASGGEDRAIRLWRVSDGRLLRILSGHTEAVGHLAFSPDGTLLASGSWDGTVRLWGVR